MDDNLSKEQFDLIRKILREKPAQEERPLKRKKRLTRSSTVNRIDKNDGKVVVIDLDAEPVDKEVSTIVEQEPIVLSSGDEHTNDKNLNLDGDEDNSIATSLYGYDDDDDEDDFDSDEFEDVIDSEELDTGQDISITIDTDKYKNQQSVSKRKRNVERNVCSNEERKSRKDDHKLYLICCLVSGYIRNGWINSPKLYKRLSKLIPDKIFELLHPKKDEEMPLRSTRKLLDGLKKAMEIWQKHWKIMKNYENVSYYMRLWNEIREPKNSKSKTIIKQQFIKQILKGIGDHDLAAQGFVALLRSCELNARLVMSCQPPDFTNLKKSEPLSKVQMNEEITKFPIFWCEVWDKFGKKWITIDPINFKTIEQVRLHSKLEPKGVEASKRNIMRYVIGYDRKKGCRDITRRYVHWYNCKCRRKRITKDEDEEIWYHKLIDSLHKRKRTKIDDYEDIYFDQRDQDEGMPDNIQDLKTHPLYILEQSLKQNQILRSGCKECGFLKLQNKTKGVLKVYLRSDVIDLKSSREWYMKGRILKKGSRCLKKIKKRRFNPIEGSDDEERLYPYEDTEMYIPPLANEDGEIVKNAFGNIEVFTPSMIPQNCSLIESPVSIKAAKAINVPFVKAVTSFKFEKGNKAKPVITGVVVASWFKDAVISAIDAIEYSEEQEKRQSEELRALKEWNKLLLKLRIKNDLNESYGKIIETRNSDTNNRDNDIEKESESGGFIIPEKMTLEEDHGAVHNSMDDNSEDDTPMGGFLPAQNPALKEKDRDMDTETHYLSEEEGGFLPRSPEIIEYGDVKDNINSDTDDYQNQEISDRDPVSPSKDENDYNDFMDEIGF
ncbi:hypothetical protein Kpol_1025p4 [Vanderwaltozyma polyspora DSM 70294]|uniref:Rad4 beta-hairpin domain-containing protein n=1 Tax=Vanderwaltozyma polyspora (strain ATCC 22028 / DSM 70294 / BCRC 21397 / CBS 2163 / NBRC 10782 / NRRL Y-8283 / UCD 57-17) TaxID=436907 RepID=A7TKT0_VANPO|nr:uncharacterized protein Kpol_1025p4 [Vanderwaltozyma polyspora DSM 70294]EDO17085.1 hypothetical protein Kpol_1025p4 [Vanderwaltozyma polyspora DSM 70294]